MQTIILLFLSTVTFVLSLFFIIPWLFGAPFEGTRKKLVREMIEISKVQKGDKVVELGSGDGRIVIGFAKKGAIVEGFEINPILVYMSRRKIKKENLQSKARIHWKSFWKADFSKYELIVLFQFQTIMRKLERKIKREAKDNVKIVSNTWKFPSLKLVKQKGKIRLYKLN
jgi:tRNA1(Val) A37 N6-methylase TrmN6